MIPIFRRHPVHQGLHQLNAVQQKELIEKHPYFFEIKKEKLCVRPLTIKVRTIEQSTPFTEEEITEHDYPNIDILHRYEVVDNPIDTLFIDPKDE